MIEMNFTSRFTYQKTADFWNVIESTLQSYLPDSSDYFAVVRDKVLFLLCYSYGLRSIEAVKLHIYDINLDRINSINDSRGSIYIDCNMSSRLVYPVFPEITKEIEKYLELRNHLLDDVSNNYLFITVKGNTLTSHYINKRLQFYNSKISSSRRISSLHLFRQYYICDLLRAKGISQSFINNQIGNNIINNQVYYHILPDNT